jgi:hypothetical protein
MKTLLALLLCSASAFAQVGPSAGVMSTAVLTSPSRVRGGSIVAADSVVTLNVTLPAGSTAGDLGILFAIHSYPIALPAGWTSIYSNNSGSPTFLAASKILDSTDISNGYVTVAATAPYSGYPESFTSGLAVMVGAGSGVREFQQSSGGGFGSTLTNTTTGAVINTDIAIYWAAETGTPASYPTIVPGTGSPIVLQQVTSPTTATNKAVLAYQVMPGGVLAVANTFPNGGYQAVQVIVER